jgi:tRNA A-37 threonylcarbamoyl transferase component Bud32
MMKRFLGNLVIASETALIKVFKEMEHVIKEVVTKSYADSGYDKAIKALRVYREEAINV